MKFKSTSVALLISGTLGLVGLFGCEKPATDKAAAKPGTVISTAVEGVPVDKRIKADTKAPGGKSAGFKSPAKPSPTPNLADIPVSGTALLISGRITQWDGKPASSATVTLRAHKAVGISSSPAEGSSSCVTDADGRYAVRAEGNITYALLSITGDVPQAEIRITEVPRSPRTGLRRLKRDVVLQQGFALTGRTLDEKGQLMPGIGVSIQPVRSGGPNVNTAETRSYTVQETTSTADGSFTFEETPPGKWNIGAKSPRHAPVFTSIDVPTTDPVTLQFAGIGGTITGSVRMKADGAPVGEMGIMLAPGQTTRNAADFASRFHSVESQVTTSSADGTFRFDHVSSGSLQVGINHASQIDRKLGITEPQPGPIKLADGETTEVTLFVYPGYTVTGQAYDKDTSEPLAGVSVSGPNSANKAQTDEGGIYTLKNVFAEGKVAGLSATLEGYSLHTGSEYNRSLNARLPEDFNLPAVQDLPMVRMLTISGKVVSADGVPVGHALVEFKSSRSFGSRDGGTPVNGDGTFKVHAQPFSSGFMVADAEGFGRGKSEMITLNSEDVKDVTITLEAGATVHGKVLDPAGAPVAGAKVQNLDDYSMAAGGWSTYDDAGLSNEDGSFTIRDAPRKLQLMASMDPHARSEQVNLTLQPAEIKSGVELKLRTGHEISGRVVLANGNPVIGAHLSASGNDGSHASGNAGPDGKFALKGLSEGVYSVYASGNQQSKTIENVKTGTTNLEIVLDAEDVAGLTVLGTAVDDISGEPVEGLELPGYTQMKKLDKPGTFEWKGLRANTNYGIKLKGPAHAWQNFTVDTSNKTDRFEQTFRLKRSGSITGRVLEKSSQKPIPNIPVINWGSTEFYERQREGPINHTTTAEDGTFVLAPAPGGKNTVTIRPNAPLAEVNKSIEVESEQTADMGDILIGQGATVRGRVTRGEKDEPVAGVQVRINAWAEDNRVNKFTSTDEDGRYEFTGLGAVSHSVQCGNMSKSVTPSEATPAEVNFKLGSVRVWGMVTRGGVPARASISASGPSGSLSTYAQSGKYELKDVMPGKYEFTIGNNQPAKETVEVPDAEEFQKDFALPDGAIRVTVTDASGKPVGGANVSLTQKSSGVGFDQSWSNRVTTNPTLPSGVAEFEELSPGTYSLSARKEGVGNAMSPPVTVANNQKVDVALKLETGGGTVVSIALSSATGQGVNQAWCYLDGPEGRFVHGATRDAAGLMTITNVPPGSYKATVGAWSHSSAERQVEIKAGETVTIEDVLYPTGVITWTLKKADGLSAAGADVTLTPISTDPPEKQKSGRTSPQGQYIERGLAPGTYQAVAQMQGKPAVTETFTVQAGAFASKETTVPGW